jgi:hypothetical protein
MKNTILSIAMVLLMTSCATITDFPTSVVTPAATITVKKYKDKNDNFIITITANNLASADRLDPPKKVYVVWITTKDNGVKNIGLLKNKNAKKSTLETLSSFNPIEIFITAEDEGNITFPEGIEISRTMFKN